MGVRTTKKSSVTCISKARSNCRAQLFLFSGFWDPGLPKTLRQSLGLAGAVVDRKALWSGHSAQTLSGLWELKDTKTEETIRVTRMDNGLMPHVHKRPLMRTNALN